MMSKIKKWRRWIAFILSFSLILGDIRPLSAAGEKAISFPSLTTMIYVQSGGDTGVTQLGESQYMIANNAEATITVSMQSQNLNGSDKLREVYAGVQLGYIQDGIPDLDPNQNHGIGSVSARVIANNDTWIDARYKESNPDSEELFDSNVRYIDHILMKYKGETLQSGTSAKVYSFDIKVRFDTGTKENAIINLKSFAKYKAYIHNGNIYTLDTPDEPDKWFESVETNKSTVQLVNSNLKWKATFTPISGKKADDTAPALWKKYNYQDMIAEMENISQSDEPYMDEFEFVFKFPYSYGINGIVESHMIEWLYNPNGDPIKNESDEFQEKSKYIGKLNEGGVLIYDVTDMSDTEIEHLLKSRRPKIKPIPYIYTGQGVVSVLMNKEMGGQLYSPTLVAQDPLNKCSKRRLLVRVPIGNNLTFPAGSSYTMVSTKMIPTVRFGHASATVSLSNKGQTIIQYFKKPTTGGTITKVAQSSPFYIGKAGYYTISKVTNAANYPAFHPYVEDTLPNHFDLTEIRYVLTKDEVAAMKEEYGDEILEKIFQKEDPFQMAFRNDKNEIEWKTVGSWTKEQTEDGIVWKITGIQSLALDKNFTKQIRLNFDYEFDPLELYSIDRESAMRGVIQVWGVPKKAITLRNKASVYWDYWIYHELNQLTHGWNHKVYGPYSTTADKIVTLPDLWCATQGLFDNGLKREEGDQVKGIVKKNFNGFTVRFGINNSSVLYGGRLAMDIPNIQRGKNSYIGFETQQILLKKEIFDRANLKKVEINWNDGTTSTYYLSKNSFYEYNTPWRKDKDNNYVLSKNYFAGDKIPTKVTIYFNSVEPDTKKEDVLTDDPAYIEYIGTYFYPGILTLKTVFDTNYQDNEQKEIIVRSEGSIEFENPDMKILVQSFSENPDRVDAKTVTGVKYEEQVGYTYRIGSSNNMKIEPGYLRMMLPMLTYEEGMKGISITQGLANPRFQAKEILIKKEILDQMSFEKLVITTNSNNTYTFYPTGTEGVEEKYIVSPQSDIVLNTKDWEGEVYYIDLYFDYYNENTNIDSKDNAYIQVRGATQIEGTYISRGVLSTNYPRSNNFTVNDSATIYSPTPALNSDMVSVHQIKGVRKEEGKQVGGTLNKPYAGYEYSVSAHGVGLVPGEIEVQYPSAFYADKVILSSDLLENLKDRNGKISITSCEISTSKKKLNIPVEALEKLMENSTTGDITLQMNSKFLEGIFGKDNENSQWEKEEYVTKILLKFRILNATEANKYAGSVNAYGKIIRIGNYTAYGEVRFPNEPQYPKDPIHKEQPWHSGSYASIRVQNISPWIEVKAFREETVGQREEEKLVTVGKHEVHTGYTYRFGSLSETRIEPGYLSISIPNAGDVEYFKTKEILITKELLSLMKPTGLVIENFDGVQTKYKVLEYGEEKKEGEQYLDIVWNPKDESEYTEFTKDLLLTSDMWSGEAKHIYLYFDYLKEKIANTDPIVQSAYVQIEGIPLKEGALISKGVIGNGNILGSGTYKEDQATLQTERATLSAKAYAHNVKERKTAEEKYNVLEQHEDEKPITIPIDWDTYYTYEVKTTAKYTKIPSALIRLDLNNKIRETDYEAHGFDPEKLVIPSNYAEFFEQIKGSGIVSIKVYDTQDTQAEQKKPAMFTMEQLEMDSEGNYVLKAQLWKEKGIQYPKYFEIEVANIVSKKDANNSLVLTLYGRTDWYTYKDEKDKLATNWKKLSQYLEYTLDTTITFSILNEMDPNSVSDKAYQNVPLPKVAFSADFNDYYEHKQGEEEYSPDSRKPNWVYEDTLEQADAYCTVDNKRSYHVVPYEKNITERFSLFNDSISSVEEFYARITLPILSKDEEKEKNRGFHTIKLLIEKQLYDDTFYKFEEFALRDRNEQGYEIVLQKLDSTTFQVGKRANDVVSPIEKIAVQQDGNLAIDRKQLEKWGIDSLWEVELHGTELVSRNKNELGDILITGFSDSDFTVTPYTSFQNRYDGGGYQDITKTKADMILRSQKKKPKKDKIYLRTMDEARLLVSKMFFDVQVETGYIRKEDQDAEPTLRYTQKGISKEHIRTGKMGLGTYSDVGILDVGYKSLVSFGVDFRQFLDDYTKQVTTVPNYKPNGHSVGGTDKRETFSGLYDTAKAWDYTALTGGGYIAVPYVKNYAYNTKADVELVIDLPVDEGYEPYYLKLDPRAVQSDDGKRKYIQQITLIHKNGTKEVIQQSELQKNSVKWSETDVTKKDWYRINLLSNNHFTTDSSYKKVNVTNDYYRTPSEDMVVETAVSQVIIKLKINQEETHDGKTAAIPDFGSWVNDTADMENQHMFEFVGRVNKKGKISAKANITVTTGDRIVQETRGEQNPIRQTGELDENKKTPWSLRNYYSDFIYSTYVVYRQYMAADLTSEAEMNVCHNNVPTGKNTIEESKNVTERLDYIFGTSHPYNMLMYMKKTDTKNFRSYIDKITKEHTLPPLQKDASGKYWGFKPTKYLLRVDIFEQEFVEDFVITTNQREVKMTKAQVKQLPKCDKDGTDNPSGTYYKIEFAYPEKMIMGNGIISLQEGEFLLKTEFVITNIAGDGDFASDTHGREPDIIFNNDKDDWYRVYGEVNILNGDEKNGKTLDGVNTLKVSYENKDGSSGSEQKKSTMKAFMIPLSIGSKVTLKTTEKVWDYKATKNSAGTTVAIEPMVSTYALNFKNTGTQGVTSQGEAYDHANIKQFGFSQPLPNEFRLTKITIPKQVFGEFVNSETVYTADGKSRISLFKLKVGTESVDVLPYFKENQDSYELDVNELFHNKILTAKEYQYPNTSGYTSGNTEVLDKSVIYKANKILEFQAACEIKQTGVDEKGNPLYLEHDMDLLENLDDILFEGIWVDKTKEAYDNNFDYDEYNSTPNFGKKGWGVSSTQVGYREYGTSIRMRERTNLTVNTSTFGTEGFKVSENTYTDTLLYNRVSELTGAQKRGTIVQVKGENGQWIDKQSFAYDVDRNGKGNVIIPVANGNLYAGDQVDYLLTYEAPVRSVITPDPIPLKNPKIRFTSPKGSRIIGWKFVSGNIGSTEVGESEQLRSSQDFIVTAYENNTTKVVLEDGTLYRKNSLGEDTNYKELCVQPNGAHYLAPGEQYQVIVYVEMIRDEGITQWATIKEEVSLGAEYRHNYKDYEAFKTSNTDGQVTEQEVKLSPEETVSVRGLYFTSTIRYGGSLVAPTLELKYTNLDGEELDQEEVQLTIDNLRNTTGHYQDSMEYILDLTKEVGIKGRQSYVQIATRPAISWQQKPNEALKNAKVYYQTKKEYGTDTWIELDKTVFTDPKEEVAFLRSIYCLKWIYEEVPAYFGDDGVTMPSMNPIVIEGIANYQEERKDIEKEQANEYVVMPIVVNGIGIHKHEEAEKWHTIMTTMNQTNRDVYRRKPKVKLNIQMLQVSQRQDLDTIDPMAESTLSYRPGDNILYRISVYNEKSKIKILTATNGSRTGVINAGTGKLLEPVIFDKIPTQYMDIISPVSIYVIDEEMKKLGEPIDVYRKELSQEQVQKVLSMSAIDMKDIGGAYDSAKGIDVTYNPKNIAESEVSYTVYQFDFAKIGLDLDRGQRLEIVYEAKIHDGELPVAYDLEKQRIPYRDKINKTRTHHTIPLMTGDDLIHEVALTGKRNPWLDPLEYLNGTQVRIPNYGNTTQLVSVAMNHPDRNYQKYTVDTVYAVDSNNAHNGGRIFGWERGNVGYFPSYIQPRIVDTTWFTRWQKKFSLIEDEERNLVWSQHKAHMRKGWLSGGTQMVNGEQDYYYNFGIDADRYTYTKKNYWWNNYQSVGGGDKYFDDYPVDDGKTPTIEWKENITTRLYVNNYGDEGVSGVKMLYVFPRGIRPDINKMDQMVLRCYNGGTETKRGYWHLGTYYNAYNHENYFVTMNKAETWDVVSNPNISWKIVQDPNTEQKTTASSQLLDIRRNPNGDIRYTKEEVEGCYVMEITINDELSAYWGKEEGYVYALDIPAYVYEVTESGEWFDRLYITPLDQKKNSYCQIYDTEYQVEKEYGSLGERYDLDIGGPEALYYSYYYQGCDREIGTRTLWNVPAGLYINGYNAQANRVTSNADANILEENNKEFQDITTKRKYAQLGNSAKIKKPYLRLWPDIGVRDKNGAIGQQNFIFEEEELEKKITVSANVENRFWASEYFASSERELSYQLEDGGSRGTLFDPVITMVLPYGLVPVNQDGDIMLGDKLHSTLAWSMLEEQWNDATKQYEPMEQTMIDSQNLTESAFDTKVEFDTVSKQYVIRFIPKEKNDTTIVILRNRQMARISLEVVSYDYYKNSPIKDQYQNEAIQVYLGSRQERFWYTCDQRLAKSKQSLNRYKVLSSKTVNDYRYDSKIDQYPEAYPTITQEEYTESSFMEKKPVPLFIQGEDKAQFADINTNKKEKIHWDYSYATIEEEDSFLVNSVKLFSIISQLRTEAKISTERKGGEVIWMSDSSSNLTKPLNYSDNVWYTIAFHNSDLSDHDVRRTGMIKHATFVSQIYLPSELRYDDTYEDTKDDKYADYYVEMKDETGKTVEYTPLELEEFGWRVEVKSLGFDQNGRQIVRALLVPAGNDVGRVAGQLRYQESLILHFKARVAEMDPIDMRETWDIRKNTEIFSSIYGLDGAKIDFLTLQAVGKAPFKKQDIDFIEIGSRKEVTPIPDCPKEGEQWFLDNEKYSYDKTVGFSIIQPRYSFVRTNTERVRRVFEPDVITGDVPSRDAVFRQGTMQKLLINQAGLKKGALQQFVVQYDIPYRSRLEMRPARADKSGLPIDIDVHHVSTGVWEVPDGARQKQELEENLRVYIYIRTGSDDEEYEYYDKANLDEIGGNWILVNKDGADIHTDTYVSLNRYRNVRQILWVVRHKDDPIHYPVPKGFRLNIDASSVLAGKQEVTDVDPIDPDLNEALHKNEFVKDVLDHSLEVGIYATTLKEITKSQWLNYYVSLGSMYTDTKKAPSSEQNYRAGYELVPELPYIDLFLETKYLKRLSSGNYTWSDNLLYDLDESKIVKHKVILFNADDATMKKFDVDGEEDSVSNPEIMVALPLREHLSKEDMKYIPFKKLRKETEDVYATQRSSLFNMSHVVSQSAITFSPSAIQLFDRTREGGVINPPSLMPVDADNTETNQPSIEPIKTTISGTVLDESYIGQYPEVDPSFKFYWTAYAMKIDTGELLPLDDVIEKDPEAISVRLLEDTDTRIAYVGDNVDRVMLSFRFGGKLLPGYTLVVDYLSKVEDVVRPPNAADFQIKAWVTKEGTFLPSLLPKECIRLIQPDSYTPTNVGIRGDEYDFNQNGDPNELLLEVVERSGEIKGKKELILQKYVSTELNKMDKASEDPIGVSQGGTYTFTLACQSANGQEKIDYVAPIIFDILPHKDDTSIIGSSINGTIQARPRESTWNGWLIPESVKLWTNTRLNKNDPALTEKVVDTSEYDIFVGPIKKENGKFVLQYDADGKPKLPSVTERSSSKFYASINVHGANSPYLENFVTLKELMAAKGTQADYDTVVKGIQMILLRFKNPLDAILYGQGSYHLEYSMTAPLNLPSWIGEWNDNGLKEYPSWNTMVTAAYPYDPSLVLKDDMIGYTIQESNRSGVFVQDPIRRGYIGDYVWYDYNGNGKQDEGYYDRLVDGKREVFSEAAIDINHDGTIDQEDDPGVDKVKVELLTKNGYPSNIDGQAVVKAKKGTANYDVYYVLDDETGEYVRNASGVRVTTNRGPEITYTTKDYYDSKGYYIFANLKPSEYRLRFTLPTEYRNYVLTTPKVAGQDVNIYANGSKLPILKLPNNVSDLAIDTIEGNGTTVTNPTFVTAPIYVEPVDFDDEISYDKKAMMTDIGIGKAIRYTGTVWNDNLPSAKEEQKVNGWRDEMAPNKKEDGISGIVINAYEKDKNEIAIGMDGKPIVATTDKDGNYTFDNLYPEREYIFRIDNPSDSKTNYKASFVPNPDSPLKATGDNDGSGNVRGDGSYYIETGSFKADYVYNEKGQIQFEQDGSTVANIGVDFGLIKLEPNSGFIGDCVWVDTNRNGICDENEGAYTEKLQINLKPYYYDTNGNEWKELKDTTLNSKIPEFVISDENGSYLFKNLPSIYDDGSNQYVIGYEVSVPNLPDEYTYTLLKKGQAGETDNRLGKDGYLVGDEEIENGRYLILATEIGTPTELNSSILEVTFGTGENQVTKYYSNMQSDFRMDYDIGLIKINRGGVSGTVFEDVDQDGVQNPDVDRAVSGVKVYLEALVDGEMPNTQLPYTENTEKMPFHNVVVVDQDYLLQTDKVAGKKEEQSGAKIEPMITEGGNWIVAQDPDTGKDYFVVTDEKGKYEFNNVLLYTVVNGVKKPIIYRVHIEKPMNTQVTLLQEGTDPTRDNDFGIDGNGNYVKDIISHSFILGKEQEKADYWDTKYDYMTDVFLGHVDAGLISLPIQVEIGDRVWNDLNNNGIQDMEEYGIYGMEVTLYRFNPKAETETYILNEQNEAIGIQTVQGKWEPCVDEKQRVITTKTNRKGNYHFIVPAYDTNPKSESYMQPYHYRASIEYYGTGIVSPLHTTAIDGQEIDKNLIKTMDSNGFICENLIDITVKPEDKKHIEQWFITKNSNRTLNTSNVTQDKVTIPEKEVLEKVEPAEIVEELPKDEVAHEEVVNTTEGKETESTEVIEDIAISARSEEIEWMPENAIVTLEHVNFSESTEAETLTSSAIKEKNTTSGVENTDNNTLVSQEVEVVQQWKPPVFDGIPSNNTPVGNLLGIAGSKTKIISDEFQIADGYNELDWEVSEEKADGSILYRPMDKMLVLHNLTKKKLEGQKSSFVGEAKVKVLEGSTYYFKEGQGNGETIISGSAITTREIKEKRMSFDGQLLSQVQTGSSIYVDIHSIYSDDSIDFGIYDQTLPNPNLDLEPENPKPEIPNPEVPTTPPTDEEEEIPPSEKETPKEEEKTPDKEKDPEKDKNKNPNKDKDKNPNKDKNTDKNKNSNKSKDKVSKRQDKEKDKNNSLYLTGKKYIDEDDKAKFTLVGKKHSNSTMTLILNNEWKKNGNYQVAQTSDTNNIFYHWILTFMSSNIMIYFLLLVRRKRRRKGEK